MNLRQYFLAGLLLAAMPLSLVHAEDKKVAPPPVAPAPVAGTVLMISLNDGSVITGSLKVTDIAIDTEFGPLKVPVTRIKTLTPGLDANPELQKRIVTLIDKLASADGPERDLAQRELVKLGPSVTGELQKFESDPDPERKLRIAAILEEFASAAEDAEGITVRPLIRLDSIETPDFTIVGRIVPKSFDVASSYGGLVVKLADVRKISTQQPTGPDEIAKTVSVDGGNFVFARLKETGIKLSRGDKVSIKADGTITMTPWGEQMCTPDGAQNFGWYTPNQILNGALIGKIGKNGAVFKIGSKSTFTAEQSGELMLGVAMNNNYGTQVFPGKYTAKIRVTPK
jgi:hypothetical protein